MGSLPSYSQYVSSDHTWGRKEGWKEKRKEEKKEERKEEKKEEKRRVREGGSTHKRCEVRQELVRVGGDDV